MYPKSAHFCFPSFLPSPGPFLCGDLEMQSPLFPSSVLTSIQHSLVLRSAAGRVSAQSLRKSFRPVLVAGAFRACLVRRRRRPPHRCRAAVLRKTFAESLPVFLAPLSILHSSTYLAARASALSPSLDRHIFLGMMERWTREKKKLVSSVTAIGSSRRNGFVYT